MQRQRNQAMRMSLKRSIIISKFALLVVGAGNSSSKYAVVHTAQHLIKWTLFPSNFGKLF